MWGNWLLAPELARGPVEKAGLEELGRCRIGPSDLVRRPRDFNGSGGGALVQAQVWGDRVGKVLRVVGVNLVGDAGADFQPVLENGQQVGPMGWVAEPPASAELRLQEAH